MVTKPDKNIPRRFRGNGGGKKREIKRDKKGFGMVFVVNSKLSLSFRLIYSRNIVPKIIDKVLSRILSVAMYTFSNINDSIPTCLVPCALRPITSTETP